MFWHSTVAPPTYVLRANAVAFQLHIHGYEREKGKQEQVHLVFPPPYPMNKIDRHDVGLARHHSTHT